MAKSLPSDPQITVLEDTDILVSQICFLCFFPSQDVCHLGKEGASPQLGWSHSGTLPWGSPLSSLLSPSCRPSFNVDLQMAEDLASSPLQLPGTVGSLAGAWWCGSQAHSSVQLSVQLLWPQPAGVGTGVPRSPVRWARRPGLGGPEKGASTVPAAGSSGPMVQIELRAWLGLPGASLTRQGSPWPFLGCSEVRGSRSHIRPHRLLPSGLSGGVPTELPGGLPTRKGLGTSLAHPRRSSLPQSPSQGPGTPLPAAALHACPPMGACLLPGFLLSCVRSPFLCPSLPGTQPLNVQRNFPAILQRIFVQNS
ncbi:uncharacterized protein LOC131424587 [Marmota monax]|uniref:uncharacterized protein LOC131424587 n=1 Tax=Marmota monax TaxID=9995 RepID=UPI0026EC8094|nr:uncharacterized protein LOC131424587 [Marmota monax]